MQPHGVNTFDIINLQYFFEFNVKLKMSENEKTEELEVDQEKDDVKADEIKPTKKSGGSKAGVIYLSRIPTKMNVKIIREYMSQYGEVGRIYLEPRGWSFCCSGALAFIYLDQYLIKLVFSE